MNTMIASNLVVPEPTNRRESLFNLTQYYWNFYRRTLNKMEWPEKLGMGFNGRLKNVLGRATTTRNFAVGLAYIEYATWVVERAELHKELAAHEVAHIATDHYYNDRCLHDYRWQQIFSMAGFNPRPTIDGLTTPNRIAVKCSNCGHSGTAKAIHLKRFEQKGMPVMLICSGCNTQSVFNRIGV